MNDTIGRNAAQDQPLDAMCSQDRPDSVRGQGVDEVPPGAGHDQLPVEVEGFRVLVGQVVPMARQRQSAVPLLAVCGVVPERADGGRRWSPQLPYDASQRVA